MSDDSSEIDVNRTELIFYGALECASPDERSRYVTEACGDDEQLRSSVTRLLQAHAEADEKFLEHEPLAAKLSEADAQFAFLRAERAGDWIGAYKLVEQIGEGGFGVVWMAEQEAPVRRRVALKILKPGMDTNEVIARFQAERQALALMDHPNIARVYDAGSTVLGRPFFVMELVKGTKITEYCDSANLPPRARLELFIQVCQAVQHAHQKGIIHRDLKPSNILVNEQDGSPVPKVIDFGIAKATQQPLTDMAVITRLEQMIGTPLYMSPEQAEQRALDIDTRSDIYSLGVLLYELLTGRTPFCAEELMRRGMEEIRRVIREEEPERPSTALRTMERDALTNIAKSRCTEPPRLIGVLQGDLDWIVMRALEKNRSRRYQTANGLAEEIRRHLANEPVLAGPPSRVYRFKKLVRRNRLAFSAGVTVAVTVVIGLATSMYLLVREREARLYASKTLVELQATAPAFVEQAKALWEAGDFDGAIEKLGYAAKLRPDLSEYQAAKGDLLQSVLRLSEAASAYRAALTLDAANTRAAANALLCERLLKTNPGTRELTRESLSELYAAMQSEQRPAEQLMPVARLLGAEKQLLMDFWLGKLRDLPIPAERPLEQRLSMRSDGHLALDLSGTAVSSLKLLEGMPLGELNCAGCAGISDIVHLRGLPIRELSLAGTHVYDIDPVSSLDELKVLTLSHSKVIHLEPLRGLKLESLHIDGLHIPNIAALQGMPLQELSISHTRVTDLTPLVGMPLKRLNMDRILAQDFSPLEGLPLERLEMRFTNPQNLDFLRGQGMRELFLTGCNLRLLPLLPEVKTLEALALPDDYRLAKESERAAILALRDHPHIRQFGVEQASGGGSGSLPSAKDFWNQWDYESELFKPLRDSGVRVTMKVLPDQTWEVQLAGEPVKDLTSLAKAPITRLGLENTKIQDLSPITALRLRGLSLKNTNIRDLGPLTGMPLEELDLEHTPVLDLTPLHGMPLKRLNIERTAVSDISALKGSALQEFWMGTTLVSDLSPLKGMPLRLLHIDECPRLSDVSPLLEVPTLEQLLVPKTARNLDVLRALPHLRYISFENDSHVNRPAQTSDEFWAMESPATIEDLAKQRRYVELERVLRLRIESRNTSEEWKDFARLAAVLVAQGRHEEYRTACAEMIVRAGHTEPAATLAVCCIAPTAGTSPAELERLRQTIVANPEKFPADPWFVLACASAQYRLGRWAEVTELLRDFSIDQGAAKATSFTLRAMAYHHQGDTAKVRLHFAEARKCLQWELTKPHADPAFWHETLIARLIFEEAEKMLPEEASPAKEP